MLPRFTTHVFHVREGNGRLKEDVFHEEISASADSSEALPNNLWEAQRVLAAARLDVVVRVELDWFDGTSL